MSIERYSGAKPPARVGPTGGDVAKRKPKRSPAVPTFRPSEPQPKRDMPKNTKVHFEDGTIIEPPIGSVIAISGKLRGSYGAGLDRVYDYAAIRAGNGRWYTTGSSCPDFGYRWPELLRFLQTFIDPTGERLR